MSMNQSKWEQPAATELAGIWRKKIREVVRNNIKTQLSIHGSWDKIVNQHSMELLTKDELQKIDNEILSTGRRYEWSAQISRKEAPEKYK